MKKQLFCIINKKARTIYGYERKLDAIYHHASLKYRPYLSFKVLDMRQVQRMRDYTLKGDI